MIPSITYLDRKFASRLRRVGVLLFDEPGETHVGHLDDVIVADQTVTSGQIAMNEVSRFQVLHCIRDLGETRIC